MTTTRLVGYPGIALSYDPSKKPYFECMVCDALANIVWRDVGLALLKAINQSNPLVKAGREDWFVRGAKITIRPTDDAVTWVSKGFKYSTNTGHSGRDYQNHTLNEQIEGRFAETTATKIRMGAGNAHMALDGTASGNGTGSVTMVQFTNVIRSQKDGLGAPPYIGLAHELIHALHSLNGEKKSTTDAEESRTVGLGDYSDEAICENAFRREARLALRTSY